MKTKLFILAIMACFTFTQCAKDGATGPAGPAGTNGVANITTWEYSNSDYTWQTGSNYLYVNLSISQITDAVNDAVVVSISINGGTTWVPLPVSNYFYTGDNMIDAVSTGNVEIIYNETTQPATNVWFKVQVIPPAILHKYPRLSASQILNNQ